MNETRDPRLCRFLIRLLIHICKAPYARAIRGCGVYFIFFSDCQVVVIFICDSSIFYILSVVLVAFVKFLINEYGVCI